MDSRDVGPVTVTRDLKDVINLKGQINWKIHNFLDWAKLKKKGYFKLSPTYKLTFPEVNKSYKFDILI